MNVSRIFFVFLLLYYLSLLDVMIKLPLVLVWAWYDLLTDCTIVLSPVYLYWHYLSKYNDDDDDDDDDDVVSAHNLWRQQLNSPYTLARLKPCRLPQQDQVELCKLLLPIWLSVPNIRSLERCQRKCRGASPEKLSGVARTCFQGISQFTCTFNPQSEWAIPAFAFPAIASRPTHLPIPEGWKAELAWVAGYVVSQVTCPKAVTHPTAINRAQCVRQRKNLPRDRSLQIVMPIASWKLSSA